VLTPEYFKKMTEKSEYSGWKPKWLKILETPEEKDLYPGCESRRFTRVLRNKDFTYALSATGRSTLTATCFQEAGRKKTQSLRSIYIYSAVFCWVIRINASFRCSSGPMTLKLFPSNPEDIALRDRIVKIVDELKN
jgi:hypothetical protein